MAMAINTKDFDFEDAIELLFKEKYEQRNNVILTSVNIAEYCNNGLVASSYDLFKDISIRQRNIDQFQATQDMKDNKNTNQRCFATRKDISFQRIQKQKA